jgi:hypothetical protein
MGIDAGAGGTILELINASDQLNLPATPPSLDANGAPWEVDVKNLGPRPVKVIGKAGFSVRIMAGQTVRIACDGKAYIIKH